jgi:hypothetical protein
MSNKESYLAYWTQKTIPIMYIDAMPTSPLAGDWRLESKYGASLGGTLCYINNPTLRLFSHTCLHISRTRLDTTSDDVQMRRHKKQKQDKHHHHGGAACPSSGMDLMNPCRWRGMDLMNPCRLRGGRPCTCSILCGRRSN